MSPKREAAPTGISWCLPAVGILVAATLTLILLELVCLRRNAQFGLDLPFLADTRILAGRSEGRVLSYLDPLLGAAQNPLAMEANRHKIFQGFEIHGDPGDSRALRIITLGGSTTEGFVGDWPKALYEEYRKAGVPVVVFNGGVSGYDSAQEFLKLARDGIMLRPDIVITYDGVNDRDTGGDRGAYGRLIHRIHKRVYPYLVSGGAPFLFPNTVAALRRVFFSGNMIEGIAWGMPPSATAADEWLLNIRSMRAIAREFGFHYAAFLQPAFGVGAGHLSAEERRRIEVPGELRKSLDKFYTGALRLALGRDYVIDLTGVFAGRAGLYMDFCHVNEEGNHLIAHAVFLELQSRGWARGLRPG